MKDLTWYLLQESLITEGTTKISAEQWKKFESPGRGGETSALGDWKKSLGLKSLKITDNKQFKCNTSDGIKEIKDELGIQNQTDPFEIFELVFKKPTPLSLLGKKQVNKVQIGDKAGIEIVLTSNWAKNIMNRKLSSMRFLRFWIESILIATGFASASKVRGQWSIKWNQNSMYICKL